MNGSGWSNYIPFPTSFQNSISALYSYQAPVQPALKDSYARAAHMNQCFVLFAGSEHSMCNDAQSSIADIIYGSQTEQSGCDE